MLYLCNIIFLTIVFCGKIVVIDKKKLAKHIRKANCLLKHLLLPNVNIY